MKQIYLLCVALVATMFVGCCYTPVETFAEADDPTPLTEAQAEAWKGVDGLNAAWGTADLAYSRSIVPQEVAATCAVAGWRNEKVSAQIILWTNENIDGVECKISDFKSADATLPASIAEARFVRYTLGDVRDENCRCRRPNGHPAILQADMLDNLDRFDIPANSVRPVWVTVNIPADATPGVYNAKVKVSHNGCGSITLPLEVEVVGQTLPAPREWAYHLDFWQHPSAIARVEGLECWSDAHFEAMRPYMQMLADAGQKVITANLNRDPWGYQCFDDYEAMIHWSRYDNNVWKYDYTIFDKWVEYMMSFGIDKQINCYSMVPWRTIIDYHDMRSTSKDNSLRQIQAVPGTPAFEEAWGPFLVDFTKHLREKGWLHKTNIALDERDPKDMDEAVRVLKKYAPELGFAIADNHDSYKRYDNVMHDVCVAQRHSVADHSDILKRREQGLVTTFYVCCSTVYPNAFTNSDPYESELLCVYGAAHDYDGMLRWAYNSWPARPEYDSRFRRWASGDTFIIYPGARSSARFERLIDGVEFSEKVRILRSKYAGHEALKPLEEALLEFTVHRYEKGKSDPICDINNMELPWRERLAKVNKALIEASKVLAE